MFYNDNVLKTLKFIIGVGARVLPPFRDLNEIRKPSYFRKKYEKIFSDSS